MTPIEQTYLKIPCRACGQVTPHVDNATTTQCQVCFTSNFHLSVKTEYYTGWEFAAFWQKKYYERGMGVGGTPCVIAAIADHYNYPSYWIEGKPVNVVLAEPIAGGMLVSS